MNGHRWGDDGPPPEAYSRVTSPERFASLHDVAAQLLDRLELDFDVERTEGGSLGPELEDGCELLRPTVTLAPRDADAAPVVIAFSAFPGLRVRFGGWCTMAFPTCGCDACGETAETESERLKSLIDDLTAGRFREAIQIPADGPARQRGEFWSVTARCVSESQIDHARARQLVAAGGPSSYEWGPWPRRK